MKVTTLFNDGETAGIFNMRTKEKSLSVLIHELDTVFSRFIRTRDTHNGVIKCFTCDAKMSFQQAQCGHFIDRDQMPTRYDEMNCRSVCEKCNCYDPGHKEKFRQKLMLILTEEGMEHLIIKSKSLQKFFKFEIENLIEVYQLKIKELKK